MDIVLRASVLYFLVLLLMRVIGRRAIAEMSPFELVVLIVMGDLIQQGVTQEDYSVTGAVLAIGTMGLWSVVISYGGFRSRRFGELAYGAPALVFHNGRPAPDVLRTHRLDVEDLLEAARQQGIEDLGDVKFAVLEPEGQFSFVRHDRAQTHPPSNTAE